MCLLAHSLPSRSHQTGRTGGRKSSGGSEHEISASVRPWAHAASDHRRASRPCRRFSCRRVCADCAPIDHELSSKLSLAKDFRMSLNRTTKVCCDCRTEKPLDAFHNCVDSPDGKQYRCIPCRKTYDQARHRTRRPKVSDALKSWLSIGVAA